MLLLYQTGALQIDPGDFVLSGNCVLNSTELVILRNQTNILAIQGTQRTELCTISKTYVPYQQATFQVMGGSKLTLQYIKLHGVDVSVGSQVGVGGEWLSGGGNVGMYVVELRIREQTAAGYAALSALWEEPLPLQTQHLFYIRIAKLASLFQEGPLSL